VDQSPIKDNVQIHSVTWTRPVWEDEATYSWWLEKIWRP